MEIATVREAVEKYNAEVIQVDTLFLIVIPKKDGTRAYYKIWKAKTKKKISDKKFKEKLLDMRIILPFGVEENK